MTSTPTPTTLDLDALERLCDEASPGPWDVHTDANGRPSLKGLGLISIADFYHPPDGDGRINTLLAGVSRTALPALIAKCREQAAEIDQLAAYLSDRDQQLAAAQERIKVAEQKVAGLLVDMCDGDYRCNARNNIDRYIMQLQLIRRSFATKEQS